MNRCQITATLCLLLAFAPAAHAWTPFGGGYKQQIEAENIETDTTNFDNNLSAADTDIQKALDTLDEMAGGGGTPGGSDTQVQFNDASAFGGDAGLTYNKTTDTLTSVNFVGALTGNASTVTVADAASDATTFLLLATDATGSLAPATDSALTYNSSTNTLVISSLDARGSAIFNETGADVDFRIESDNVTDIFQVDASADTAYLNGTYSKKSNGVSSFYLPNVTGLSGLYNTIVGEDSSMAAGYAGQDLNSGTGNVLIGAGAGPNFTTVSNNTCVGYRSCEDPVTANKVVAIGFGAYAHGLATGNVNNTYVGHDAGAGSGAGDGVNNTCVGTACMNTISTGDRNTTIGSSAGSSMTTGNDNTLLGVIACDASGTKNGNTCVGSLAGNANNGAYNVFLGYNTASTVSAINNTFSSGSEGQPISDVWFGGGVDKAASAIPYIIHGTDTVGTDITGGNVTIAGGRGTGSGVGGSLIFQTAPAGSTGTAAGTLTTALTIDSTGKSTVVNADITSGITATASADDSDTSLATTAFVQQEINGSGGRSLSASSGSVNADVELYTDTKCIRFESPVAADDLKSIWMNDTANGFTLTKLWCESDQTVTAMLQVDDGSPADVDGTDLVCISTPDTDTSLDGDATMAAGDRLDIDIASVSGTPTWVSICWTGAWDD